MEAVNTETKTAGNSAKQFYMFKRAEGQSRSAHCASNGPGHRSAKLRLPSGDVTGLSWERMQNPVHTCSLTLAHVHPSATGSKNEAAPCRLLDARRCCFQASLSCLSPHLLPVMNVEVHPRLPEIDGQKRHTPSFSYLARTCMSALRWPTPPPPPPSPSRPRAGGSGQWCRWRRWCRWCRWCCWYRWCRWYCGKVP